MWVRKAGPKTIVPTGLEGPGGRERGRAGARSPIRAAGTVLRPGAAGGRGRWRGGRRAAAPPGRRASCRGPRGAGTLLGGAPSAGRRAPSWTRRFLRSSGLQPRDAGSLLGRGWMSLPNLGVPPGWGSVCWKRGTLWGGDPHQGAQPRRRSPGVLRARGESGKRGGSGAASRSRRARGSRGKTGIPRRAGSWGYAGGPGARKVPGVRRAPGDAQWDKCSGGRGGGGGQVCVPSCP